MVSTLFRRSLPEGLPQQARYAIEMLAEMNDRLAALSAMLGASLSERPNPDSVLIRIPPGGFVTSQKLLILKIIAYATAGGVFSVWLGTSQLFTFAGSANSTVALDFSGLSRITAGRGLNFDITGPAGVSSYIIAVPS